MSPEFASYRTLKIKLPKLDFTTTKHMCHICLGIYYVSENFKTNYDLE